MAVVVGTPAADGPAEIGVVGTVTAGSEAVKTAIAGPGVVGTTFAVAGPSSIVAVCAVIVDSVGVARTPVADTDTWGTAAAAAAAGGVTRSGVALSSARACPLAEPSCLHSEHELESQASHCNCN